MKYTDPLRRLYEKKGCQSQLIEQLVIGEKYVGCLLKNGNLGVCATLGTNFPAAYHFPAQPDLNAVTDRIVLNAYFNASLNYDRDYPEVSDIFDFIPFERYRNIVMIGYFASLVSKFESAGIHLDIFDLNENQPGVRALEQKAAFIERADALILTSTTLFNQSFPHLLASTKAGTEVFMLGPSTILNPLLLTYPNVSRIFGMIFPKQSREVLSLISQGLGTPAFGKFGAKVYM